MRTGLQQSNQELIEKFKKQTAASQFQIVDKINTRTRDTTRLGAVFNDINRRVRADVIDEATLEERAKYDRKAAFAWDTYERDGSENKGKGEGVASYIQVADLILLEHPAPEAHLFTMLRDGITPDGLLAHERLHAVQHRASEMMPLYDFLIRKGLTRDGKFYFQEEMAAQFSAFLPGVRNVIPYIIKVLQEQNVAYEIGARFLTPVFEDGQYSIIPEEIAGGARTLQDIDLAFAFVLRAAGHYAARLNGADVDIKTNHLVGKYGRCLSTIDANYKELDRPENIEAGLDFLRERNKMMQDVIEIARNELRLL